MKVNLEFDLNDQDDNNEYNLILKTGHMENKIKEIQRLIDLSDEIPDTEILNQIHFLLKDENYGGE